MMPTSFDVVCPVCEAVTTASDSQQNQELPCPQCGYAFIWRAHEGWQQSDDASPWPALLDRLPLPDLVEVELLRRRNSLPPTVPPRKSGRPEVQVPLVATSGSSIDEVMAPPPQETLPSETAETPAPWSAEDEPHPAAVPHKSGWLGVSVLWWLSGLCLVACFAVVLISWMLGDRDPKPPAGDANLAESNGGQIDPTGQSDPSGDVEPFISTMLTAEGLDSAWQNLAPYLVSVHVTSDSQVTTTTGLLIDTRGWVLIKASSLVGINSGNLDVAPLDWRRAVAQALRSGECRGLIGQHPELDLAVIAVDPTPFHVFTDLEFAPLDPASTQVLIAGCPGDGRSWWQDAASVPAPPNRLTITSPIESARLAGPVVDSHGKPIGVVTLDQASAHPQVIGHDEIQAWLSSLSGDSKAWSEVSIAPFTPADPAAPAEAATKVDSVPPPISLEAIGYMEQLAQRLSDQDWHVLAEDDLVTAQQLVQYVTAVEANVDNPSIEEGIRVLLGQAVDEIRNQVQRSPWPAADVVAATNALAVEQVKAHQGVWAYGEVALSPGLAPEYQGQGTVVFRLLRTEDWLILPVSENFDQLKTGTHWLIWGDTGELRQLTFEDAEGNPQTGILVDARFLMAEPELVSTTP